jgi:formate-dependent nitrite reductase cytochrome c552 subunit
MRKAGAHVAIFDLFHKRRRKYEKILAGSAQGMSGFDTTFSSPSSRDCHDAAACCPGYAKQICHRFEENEIKSRVEAIQDRTKGLIERAEVGVKDLFDALKAAKEKGIPEAKLTAAQALHRKAQWRLDFIMAENSMGFHGAQESARILGEAIDYARQGQIRILEIGPP